MHDGSYRFFDHTADIGLEITAPSIERLFETAGVALFDLIAEVADVTPALERAVAVDGADPSDPADLLVRWLSELLYIHDTEGMLFCRFVVRSAAAGKLEATALGEAYDPERHQLKREVKAITYHQASVRQRDGGWIARVICDI